MKVLMINSVCGIRSTGRICTDIATALEAQGHEVKIAYGREEVPEKFQKYAVRIGTDLDVKAHGFTARLFDTQGLGSKSATRRFLKWAEDYGPDLLWLHNIHGYYINYEMLFTWIKSHSEMEVRWTLHDCWAFTGHCTYFTYAKCDKWKNHCKNCPQKKTYPASLLFDQSNKNFDRKRDLFTGVSRMTIITPSKWLAGLVKESYLAEYPVEVIYNNIDTEVFKPTKSSFRKEHGIENKKMILAVSNAWQEPRKGLADIYKIREQLDESYAVVVIGLTEELMKTVPEGVIGITKTSNASELAGIYTTADVLINPTYEDNYPTVNIESQACGTPVVTYRTGGSPESVQEENVVEVGDIEGLCKRVIQLTEWRK